MGLLAAWASLKAKISRALGWPPPKTNSLFFDGMGPVCRDIKQGAKSWRALHLIYNYGFPKPTSIGDRVDNLWLKSPNAQGVRNRHRIAKRKMMEAIMSHPSDQEVRILSLASGSAECVLESVEKALTLGLRVRCLLLDVDQSANIFAADLARKKGISEYVETVQVNITSIGKVAKVLDSFQPHIVEMMGLLDYLSDKKATNLMRTIRNGLPVGGRFLTCNIMPNKERPFLTHVLKWEMIYRTSDQVTDLFKAAGFHDPVAFIEPMRIHVIVVGKVKNSVRKQAA